MKSQKKLLGILLIMGFLISVGMTLGVSYKQDDVKNPITEVMDADTDPEDAEDDIDDEDADDDDDGIDDDYEDENEREVKIEYSDNEIQIESQLKTGDNKDEFQIKVEAGDDLGIKLEYESEITTDGVETELELEFKVVFKSLIEFIDMDDNGIYNSDNDTEIQEYKFEDFDFDPIEYTPILQPDNSTLHYLNISTVDNVFTAHLFVAGEFMNLSTTVLTPTEVKIDIEINDFPYLNDSSQLAVYTKLETSSEMEEDDETEDEENGYVEEEGGVVTEMNGFMADFTWAETALIDGTVMSVSTTPIDIDDTDSNAEKMYIVYPRGTHIYHDPKIGMVGILTEAPAPSFLESIPGFPVWTLFAFSAAIVAMIAIKRKKN